MNPVNLMLSEIKVNTCTYDMFRRHSVECIVKIVSLKLYFVSYRIVTCDIVPGFLPLVPPCEHLDSKIRAEPGVRDSVLDFKSRAQDVTLAARLRSPAMLVTFPDRDFQPALLQRSREIGNRLVGKPGRFPDEIVSHIELKPWTKFHSKSRPGVPTFQTLVLVVVMLEIKGGEYRGFPEVVIDFEELPTAKGVVLNLLRLNRPGEED